MRQLTGLDAQFLALETPRQSGHVGALAVLDPSTRPNGRLELADVHNMMAERLPLLPPFRWRLKPVPLGLDYPYWIDDPDFDLEYHVREIALAPPPTDEKLGEQVARIFGAAARPGAAVVGGVPDPRAAERSRCAADEDPPLRRRRHVRSGDPQRAARPHARRPRTTTAGRLPARRGAERSRDARPWPAWRPEVHGTRGPGAALDAAQPRGRADAQRDPRRQAVGQDHGARDARAAAPGIPGARAHVTHAPAHVIQRPRLPAPAIRVRPSCRSTRSRRSRTPTGTRSTTS